MNMPTIAYINIDNLTKNYHLVEKLTKTSIIPIVKADAYGHGCIEVSQILSSFSSTKYLGVAYSQEGKLLREKGIEKPILILSYISDDFHIIDEYNLTPTLYSLSLIDKMADFAKQKGKRVNVHIKIDTGMNRLGINYKDAQKTYEKLEEYRDFLNVEGIMSHLCCADNDDEFTLIQLNRFNDAVSFLESKGFYFEYKHIANSAAIVNFPQTYLNCVRPGIILYGYMPNKNMHNPGFNPMLSIKSHIIHIHDLYPEEGVSYGRTFVTKEKIKVGVIAIGYADGFQRTLSNNFYVLIKGKKSAIIGNVCMDMIMCNLTYINAKVGDEVIILGKDQDEKIDAWDYATKTNTIPYEILTNMGKRIQRIYIKK
jgi:alanine racemase